MDNQPEIDVNHILELGCGTQLAKIDIKDAFRLIPVHPTDRHLLGIGKMAYT